MPSDEDLCTHQDILAINSFLTEQLSAISPVNTSIATDTAKAVSARAVRKKASTSGWKTLGLGNVGSYLRVPSLPGMPGQSAILPASSATPTHRPDGPTDPGKDEEEGADWMAISTFGLFGKKGGKKAAAVPPMTAKTVTRTHAVPVEAAGPTAIATVTVQLEAEAVVRTRDGNGKVSSTVEHASVDDELKDAIEAGLSLPQTPSEEAEPPTDNAKMQSLPVQRVWLGEPGAWCSLRCSIVRTSRTRSHYILTIPIDHSLTTLPLRTSAALTRLQKSKTRRRSQICRLSTW